MWQRHKRVCNSIGVDGRIPLENVYVVTVIIRQCEFVKSTFIIVMVRNTTNATKELHAQLDIHKSEDNKVMRT